MGNGLSSVWCQFLTITDAETSLIDPLRTHFSEIWFKIGTVLSKKTFKCALLYGDHFVTALVCHKYWRRCTPRRSIYSTQWIATGSICRNYALKINIRNVPLQCQKNLPLHRNFSRDMYWFKWHSFQQTQYLWNQYWVVTGKSPQTCPVTRKMFPFDDVIMIKQELGNLYSFGTPIEWNEIFLY